MRSNSSIRLVRRSLALIAAACAFATAPAAQSDKANPNDKKSDPLESLPDPRGAAFDALRKGDFEKADGLLIAASVGTPNSAEWRLSYADQLITAAIDLQTRGQLKQSTDYFHRAAAQMLAALEASDSPKAAPLKSRIYQTLGFIARVADSDVQKANGYLKQAVALDSANEGARRGLQRTKEGRADLDVLDRKSGGGR